MGGGAPGSDPLASGVGPGATAWQHWWLRMALGGAHPLGETLWGVFREGGRWVVAPGLAHWGAQPGR